ncbi:LysR family transcriptional regulator [Ideonella sp. A 288]|uniref:LysR family transcriptional regulator n=1 Tax=Ideonella sp. A 288 TaxID=1962181 RepID=UPI000B4BA62E|nr:LysR family transcriptional regulator [Ideonella sp. A 288]
MKLTHRQIEVFRAVMAAGHVTRAADAMGSSQPTVSRELARLERTLGMALFDRVRGRLRPTVRAMALLDEVERSFIGLERIAAAAAGLREFAQGRLALACLPALGHALLPDAARRFLLGHPQAGLSITSQESPLLEQQLTEQRFDLGLVEARQAPPATALKPLLQADEVAVLPDGHPLLARRVLRPRDFAGQAFVSLARADPYRQAVDALFESQAVARTMAVEAASAVTVCALVRQGLGVAIVNPLTALELAGPGLHIRPLSVSIPFHVGLVRPELRAPSPLAEPFERALFEAAAALQARLVGLSRKA